MWLGLLRHEQTLTNQFLKYGLTSVYSRGYLGTPIWVLSYPVLGPVYRIPYAYNNPIRVGVHIACIRERRDVDTPLSLVRSLHPDQYILIFLN
jgi:hypothetical protein